MDFAEFQQLINTKQPLIREILANGRHRVGEVRFSPTQLYEALISLYDSGDIKVFENEADEEIALERLRKLPPDEYEVAEFRRLQVIKGQLPLSHSDIVKELTTQLVDAKSETLRKRLIRKMVRWIIIVMMRDFDGLFSDAVLQIQSIGQMRAENEIRKELNMRVLSAPETQHFVLHPGKDRIKKLLKVKRGGDRYGDKFRWDKQQKQVFYETTTNLTCNNGEPLWQFAYNELVKQDFSDQIVRELRRKTDLKKVPATLWKDAVDAWRGNASSFENLSADKTWKAFAMYHAIELLGCSPLAYSTMKKYFHQGKTASKQKSN